MGAWGKVDAGDYSPTAIADALAANYRSRGTYTKALCVLAILGTLVPAALIPLCLVIAPHVSTLYLGQLIPSALAATTALAASATLIVRPFERLKVIRHFERALLFEQARYANQREPYATQDADEVFLQRLEALTLRVYEEWVSLVPSSGDVASVRNLQQPQRDPAG